MNEIRKRGSLPEGIPTVVPEATATLDGWPYSVLENPVEPVWNFPQVLEPDPTHDPGTTRCAACGETISPSDEQFAFLKGDTYKFYHAWCKPQPEL